MDTKTEEFCEVSVTHKIDRQTVEDLLTSAFEGGSDYWLDSAIRLVRLEGESFIDAAFNYGLIIELAEEQKRKVMLNSYMMRHGLQVLFARYPHHAKAIVDDNADAETADCWLQCCLFSEIVYG